jgi:hypothetical protein
MQMWCNSPCLKSQPLEVMQEVSEKLTAYIPHLLDLSLRI